MTETFEPRGARWSAVASKLVLWASVLTSAAFLFGSWAANAQGVGKADLGVAVGLAIASAVAVYASLLLACVSLAALALGWRLRWPVRLWLLALALSLIPSLVLLAQDVAA